jgi:selenocysteine-specific elongation factor
MIVGTAGHIDHGKTSLVRALTGVDTDRLKEEKARGISIDLGFAYVPTANGAALGFVDVPGHERFVHTMLAGATGIDFVMLVVAADDGIMPQTLEHLAIVDLLGITHGMVALTKADLVAPERRAQVAADVAAMLAATRLAGAAVVPVSTVTARGSRTCAAICSLPPLRSDAAPRAAASALPSTARSRSPAPAPS